MAEKLAKDVMSEKVISVQKETSIEELSKILLENKISGVPVVDDDGALVGIATEADLIVKDADLHFPRYFNLLGSIIYLESLEKFQNNLRKYLGTKVEDIMTVKVVSAKEDTRINEIANMMIRKKINRIPIVDDENKVIGIITRADIVESMIE
jgi:CBS domain-containing protein